MKISSNNFQSSLSSLVIWAFILPASLNWQVLSDEASTASKENLEPLVATFSIVAFDPATGDLGVAVQSKFFGVGTVVPWAKANVGAIATQSYANITYGPNGLGLLEQNIHPEAAMKQLTESDPNNAYRQVGMIDARGRASSFTGSKCNAWAGHIVGPYFAIQGNLLAGQSVVEDMAKAFQESSQLSGTELADWLMVALKAGQDAGGDKRGRQSAALLVVRENAGYSGINDRYIDLRVEDHKTPIIELNRLLQIHKQFYRQAHENKPQRKP
ncbi:DUF1028 domain-containing protein [bacterium]|nr:DUF1028 domain-containing protein [bacterium]